MDFLKHRLAEQIAAGRYRQLQPLVGRGAGGLDFSSNDYLALSIHPEVVKAGQEALAHYGAGVGAARLMSGDLRLFHQLEEEVAKLKECQAALVFGSGYLANVGIIPALVGRGDTVLTDRLDHASIYDGCRLSGAKLLRFRHNDPVHLEELLSQSQGGSGRVLVVVESLYSMDGDIAPLPALVALKEKYSCLLMVDEAHATGLYGRQGGGLVQENNLADRVDVVIGTFGKGLGSYGAYVAGSRILRDYMINRARSFIYSTGLPPAVIGASLAAVKLVRREPGLRRQLAGNVAYFKDCLIGAGMPGAPGPSQIIPIRVGESTQALGLADECRRMGLLVTAVRPPTVPEGSARIRLSVTLHQKRPQLAEAAIQLVAACRMLELRASF
jgi:glycine C-acetyltransferase/8-amino-7-oxononanoate synthase